MIKNIFIAVCILILCSCNEPKAPEEKAQMLSETDSTQFYIDSLLKKSFPIMGYRFIVTGDFNGDHIQDTLVEHYTDSLQTKEVAKYDTAFDYFDSWRLAELFNKKSFLSGTTNAFKKLNGGILGFIYIENCGDVSGDGFDDLFVVPHQGGASNCVHGYFYTLKKNEWKVLWSTGVWQWQFPPTPDAAMAPGLFGSFAVEYSTTDSINNALEDQLKKYRFIKRHADRSIEYECRNPLDYDEMDSLANLYGQQEGILKRFKPVTIDKKIYLQDLKNKNTFYGNVTREKANESWIYLFPYDDMAEMFVVRKYYKK